MISPLLCGNSRDVRNGSSCNFGWLESEPKSFEWWSRSLIFELPFNRRSLWSKPIVQTIQWLVNNTNVLDRVILEPEPNTFRWVELEPEPEI